MRRILFLVLTFLLVLSCRCFAQSPITGTNAPVPVVLLCGSPPAPCTSGNPLQTSAGGATGSSNIAQIGGSTVATGGVAGTLVVEQGCAGQSVANTTVTAINNAASSANLKLVTKVAAKNVYICALNIVAAAATNIALVDGTLTTNQCDTSQDGLAGGTTAATGWNFAANGGLTIGNGIGVVFKTAAVNKDVCLLFSAGNQVSGSITWAQF